jgi:hypothetical protein
MKIAGLKGRSPETYPSHRASGLVDTNSEVYTDPVSLTTTPANLFGAGSFAASPGDRVIVMYSGVISASSGSILVAISVVLDDATTLYTYEFEVAASNLPLPFSLVFETPAALAATPDPHAITLLGSTVSSGTATVAANGSIVLISTPS